ncbi:MAG: hypothetical protein ACYDCO_23560 [Armatimonadota bacterium]
MLTRATALLSLLTLMIVGMIVSGCSDNAPQRLTLDTSSLARYTDQDDPRPGRAYDLLDGTRRFSMPRLFGMGLGIGSLDDPASILGSFNVPAGTRDYYPLRAHMKSGEPAQPQAWLTRAQITPGLLAGALARAARGSTRATNNINFQDPDTGISWAGSYWYNEDRTEITLNVVGSRDGLTIRLSLTASIEETADIDGIIGNMQFTYTLTITGQTENGESGTDMVDGTITASGTLAMDIEADNGSMEQTLNSRVTFAINKRICYQAGTGINLSLTIADGSMAGISLSFDNDGWFFAPDGYWIHGTSSIDVSQTLGTEPIATIAFDLEASDGYHLTLTDGAGTLTDASGNVLATLTFDPIDGYLDLDFSDELNALGLEDGEMPVIPF